MSGIIPPDGTTEILITFYPTQHRTAHMTLVVNIAQFDFEPVSIRVVGNSLPGLAQERVLQHGEGEQTLVMKQALQESMTTKVGSLHGKRTRGPLELKPPKFVHDPSEKMVDGLKVPTRFNTQATSFVLNQTAGKVPLKDLYSFICKQRESAERRRLQAEAAHAAGQSDDDEEEENDIQALELRFGLQYRDVAKYNKEKELNSRVALGEDQRTIDEVESIRKKHIRKQSAILESTLAQDVNRIESVRNEAACVGIPTSYVHKLTPDWDEHSNDMFGMRLQVIERFVRAGSKCLMRMRVRKAAAAIKEAMVVCQVTPADRDGVRAWVDAENKAAIAGGSSAQASKSTTTKSKAVGSGSATEDTDANGEGNEASDIVEFVRIPMNFCLPVQIPVHQDVDADDKKPVPVDAPTNFEDFPEILVKARLDYKVLDYPTQYMLPPPAAYMRPNDGSRSRLSAALEEHSIRGPCGDFLDGAEKPLAMPNFCQKPAKSDSAKSESILSASGELDKHSLICKMKALSLLIPNPNCRTYVALPDFTECDTEHRLGELPDLILPPETEPLLPSDIMSLETPWLSIWRPQRQIEDPFCHFDPFPCSFNEAGGSHGPRLGFDAGGERLSFLPVGGLSRDIPSDTDDDDKEDAEAFDHTKPPPDDLYEAARKGLTRPVDCERWQKERKLEARLCKRCDENNRATRERMRDLNKHLSPSNGRDPDASNKLYLG
jgi:hypothetical protein